MKKIISKILIIFIIIITLFEFIFSPNASYAALEFTDEFVNGLISLMGGMVAYGIWLNRLIMLAVSTVFNGFMSTSFAACCGVNEGFSIGIATPYSIFFNKYKLFDVNFFDLSKNTENGPIISIRTAVAEWFYVIRNISSAVLLCILIYVGIRMALSTIAEEKAKYKKMFFDWACSLALIYVLQYIIMFTVYSNNAIVNALKEMYKGSDMDTAMIQIALQAVMPVGISSIIATIVYCMIVFQTIAFMISYTQRMLKTGFLILISPLISITYSIDKMGDGKAQALNSWLKEFVYTILIQPFHCIIYMAFVTTAVKLLWESTVIDAILDIFAGEGLQAQLEFNQLTNGVLVILCLKFINDGEKAIRKIFNFQDDGNLTSMAAGAMVGVAVLKNAQNIGQTASKGFNSATEKLSKLSGNFQKDFAGFKNTEAGKKFMNNKTVQNISSFAKNTSQTAQKATKFISDKKEKITGKWKGKDGLSLKQKYLNMSNNFHKSIGEYANDPKNNRLLRKGVSWAAKNIPTAQNFKNALPGALGMMGAAMSYAAGDSGAMEAIGVGTTFEKNASDYFSSTLGTLSEEKSRTQEAHIESSYQLEKSKRDEKISSSATSNQEKYDTEDKRNAVVQQYVADMPLLDSADKKIEEAKENGTDNPNLTKEEQEAVNRRTQLEKDGVLGAVASRAELEGEGAEKFKEAVRNDDHQNGANYGSKEIEKKGKEIIKLIEAYKKKLAEAGGGMNSDASTEKHLGEDSTSSPERMLQTLKNSIDSSVVFAQGGDYDVSRMLQERLNIHNDGKDEYQKIVKSVLEYREMIANDANFAVDEKASKVGISKDKLYGRIAQN